MKKWLRRFAKLAVWSLALLVLFIVEENIRGRILLAAYKRELRAAGEKLNLAELGLTKAPPAPDAATIDLLAAAKKLGDWNPHDQWEADTQRSLRFMRPVISGAATFSWNGSVMDNAHLQVVANGWPVVADRLRSNAPALSAAMEALQRNPQGVSHDFREASDESTISANSLSNRLRYWLMWATANNLREGNLDGAGNAILAIARLGKTSEAQYFGSRSFTQCGLNATWELLHSGATNDEQLASLCRIWVRGTVVRDRPKRAQAYRAWNLERIEAQTWKAAPDNSASNIVYRLELQNVSPSTAALWFLAGRYFDEYAYLAISQANLESVRVLAQTRRWNAHHEPPWPKRILWGLPWFQEMLFVYSDGWYFSEGMLRSVEFETHREMTVAAIALQRFRLRHGRWPEKLEELVPELLPVLPRDWMDGQPLRYRRNANDTFTLYSVGEDLRDDGGDLTDVPNRNMDAHPLPMWTTRDAVWPYVATDESITAIKHAALAKKEQHSSSR